ncbi:MAG: hypothetical protein WAO76_03835 [Georgfuchsia sp.]
MFENLISQLKQLDGQKVSVPIETDNSGFIDKQCPSESCEFLFKVNEQDWKNIFRDEAVWCPMCGHSAPADQWFTVEQVTHARSEALKVIKGGIHNALLSDAQKFNLRQPKTAFISMSLKVQGGHQRTYVIPASAAEAMQLEIQCEQCSSRFAVIGCAYFCPACGHNSVERTFQDSLRKICAKKENLDLVKAALTNAGKKDDAEITCRSLIESCLLDGVTAFQKYCEGLFDSTERPVKRSLNAFQRLDQGSDLWKTSIGFTYTDILSTQELLLLKVLYQKRHILAHNEGIVDDRYLKESEDTRYKIGQRVSVSVGEVEGLVDCLTKLANGLRNNNPRSLAKPNKLKKSG